MHKWSFNTVSNDSSAIGNDHNVTSLLDIPYEFINGIKNNGQDVGKALSTIAPYLENIPIQPEPSISGGARNKLGSSAVNILLAASDGIVFTNQNGLITYVNESFLELINAAQGSEIVGRSLGDFLSKGQIDLAVMLENVQRSGRMRIYSTDLQNDFGLKTAVEVSMTKISSDTTEQISFVIREISRAEQPEPIKPSISSGNNSPSVTELVGSASLKEIVAETTDVIETIS